MFKLFSTKLCHSLLKSLEHGLDVYQPKQVAAQTNNGLSRDGPFWLEPFEICSHNSDNCTCCHTEVPVAQQICYLTQSEHSSPRPTSPGADPLTPGGVATGAAMLNS